MLIERGKLLYGSVPVLTWWDRASKTSLLALAELRATSSHLMKGHYGHHKSAFCKDVSPLKCLWATEEKKKKCTSFP